MKVLFLDFDGVLNSRRTCVVYDGYPFDLEKDFQQFDHVGIGLVRKIVEKTGCKVVVSSSWRHGTSIDKMIKILDLPIIGITPVRGSFYKEAGYSLPMSASRGNEIDEWLKVHSEVTKFAILDDEKFDIHQPELVQTSMADGLLYEHYERVVKLLGDIND